MTDEERRPTWDDFIAPWDKWTSKIEEFVLESAAPGRNAARSAIRHAQRALAVMEIDPEGAALHAATAEEEASTAIFHALKRRGYAGAERLSPKNHDHKGAVVPFFKAVCRFIARTSEAEGINIFPTFAAKGDERRLQLGIWPRSLGIEGAWFPIPPLHGTISLNDEPYDFHVELQEFARESGVKSPLEAIRKRTKRRRIDPWYARTEGIPTMTGPFEGPLNRTRDQVYGQLTTFLFIDQYPERQDFVQQALNAFLKILPSPRPKASRTASAVPPLVTPPACGV